jgi:hypothetical protein
MRDRAKHKERRVEQHVQRTSYTRTMTQVEQTCPICKQQFWGGAIRKYCSQPCRQKANYQRHAEQYRKDRREHYQEQKAK